jgi:hypothetical protein
MRNKRRKWSEQTLISCFGLIKEALSFAERKLRESNYASEVKASVRYTAASA